MKIKIGVGGRDHGQIIATSENVSEASALLSLIGTRKRNRWDTTVIDTAEATKVLTAGNTAHRKPIKHKKECPTCGKRRKYLDSHIAHMHPAPVTIA